MPILHGRPFPPIKRPGSRRAFSLIELMLAMLIFSTGYLAVLGILPSSMRAVHMSRITLLVSHVAEEKMEQYGTGVPFASLASVSGPDVPLISSANGVTETVHVHWQVEVTTLSPDLKDVRVQAYCSDFGQTCGPTASAPVNFDSLVANL